MGRFGVSLAASLVSGALGCVGVDEVFVALDDPSAEQWILIEGEGDDARITALDPGTAAFRAPEDSRIRVLIYREAVLAAPLPVISTRGALLPTPSSFLELVPSEDGYGWRETAFSALELRIEEPTFCAGVETESLIPLPLLIDGDQRKTSLVLRDGRLLVGGEDALFAVESAGTAQMVWTSTAGWRGGPRSLSEGAAGLWFEANGELLFSPLSPGFEIRTERRSVLPPGQTDFIYTTPEEDRLILVDQDGRVFEHSEARGTQLLLHSEPNTRVLILGRDELGLVREGDVELQTFARYARYEAGAWEDEAPFGEEPTRRVKTIVSGTDYFTGAEGGRAAVDRGTGWQRVDLQSGSLGRVQGFAPTDRGFLAGTSNGELVEYVWGRGYCPPASFQAATIEAVHALGDERYAIVPDFLEDGVRILRLLPP